MSDTPDPQSITSAGTSEAIKKMRFWEVGKTFQEMFKEPCVDVMIMTRDNYELLKKYCEEVENPIPFGIKIFIHNWVGDLILYGSMRNKLIKQILETCDGTGPLEIKEGGPMIV